MNTENIVSIEPVRPNHLRDPMSRMFGIDYVHAVQLTVTPHDSGLVVLGVFSYGDFDTVYGAVSNRSSLAVTRTIVRPYPRLDRTDQHIADVRVKRFYTGSSDLFTRSVPLNGQDRDDLLFVRDGIVKLDSGDCADPFLDKQAASVVRDVFSYRAKHEGPKFGLQSVSEVAAAVFIDD